MVSFQVSGQPALRFKVAARAVLFAGSRRGQVEQPVCRALVERFRRHGFGFFVGCATGVDAAFRAALAHSACGPDEVFVGCAFGQRARRCRAEGLFASAVMPEGIPANAALARRTLWLVKRSSLVVLFPERPADRQWGPARGTCFDRVSTMLKPLTIGDPHESLTVCRAYASVPRLGRRMPMKRHDNSQRSSRLAVTQPTTGPRVGAVDRVAALARECSGVRRMRMMRHDDRQRSEGVKRASSADRRAGRGKVHEARIAVDFLSRPWKMVIRVDQMPMERHHDSQRRDRWPVMFGDVRVVDRVAASIASLPRLGFDGSMMKRHDDAPGWRQRSDRLAVTQPIPPSGRALARAPVGGGFTVPP